MLTQAGFTLISACKNDQLHYWIEASSLDGSGAVISDGELDPLFGNNPAILSVTENGVPLTAPRLAVPKDKTTARDVGNLFNITIGRADRLRARQHGLHAARVHPARDTSSTPGFGQRRRLGRPPSPWRQLMGMTQVGSVSFLQGQNPQVREEKGPTLYDVLSSAAPELTSIPADDTRLYVEATSSEDGASTLVSWDEFDPARNALNNTADQQYLLSLGEAVLPSPPGDTQRVCPTTSPCNVVAWCMCPATRKRGSRIRG